MDGVIEGMGGGAVKSCDYRNLDCVNDGVTVDGKWICKNHLNSARTPTQTAAVPTQQMIDAAHSAYGGMAKKSIADIWRIMCDAAPAPVDKTANPIKTATCIACNNKYTGTLADIQALEHCNSCGNDSFRIADADRQETQS